MGNNTYGTVTTTEVDNLGNNPVKHNFGVVVVGKDIANIQTVLSRVYKFLADGE